MADTLVSIVVPVYNVQGYIMECLTSIGAQTNQDGVECIIVDDHGTDDSMRLVQEFLDDYNGDIRFRIVRHERNMGLSAARNTGIVNANGKYLLFIDSDDMIYKDCLVRLMEVASRFPEAEMIAAGANTNIKSQAKYYTMEKPFPDYADNPCWIAGTVLMRGGRNGFPVTAWNRLVRKDFLIRHQLFFREGVVHEDELWNFLLAQKLSRIAFCKHNTYFHRIRPQSIITGFKTRDEDAFSCLPVWHEILEHFTPEQEKEQTQSLWHFINDISPTCRDRIVRKEVRGILWHLVRKKIWPVSFYIFLYLMPFFFYIKFIRKQIAKMSNISVSRYNCCIS